MSDDPDPSSEASHEADGLTPVGLGRALAELRHDSGMTGVELGERTSIGQSKISKIERGAALPSPREVERITRVLEVLEPQATELVEQAEQLWKERNAARAQPRESRTHHREGIEQRDFAHYEQQARRIRELDSVVVPGLLQTSEYSRRILNSFAELLADEVSPRLLRQTAAGIALRMRRQEVLYDLDKTFEFVMLESVFWNQIAYPANMLAQIDRIEAASTLPNVTVRIVPVEELLPFPAVHGFALIDDLLVLTEKVDDAVLLRKEHEIRLYRRLFEKYAELGATDIRPILTRFKEIYTERARPKEEPPTSGADRPVD